MGEIPYDSSVLTLGPLQHARHYWPYLAALLAGLMLIICIPELSLLLPRGAGFVR